jgi:hypothetical protein
MGKNRVEKAKNKERENFVEFKVFKSTVVVEEGGVGDGFGGIFLRGEQRKGKRRKRNGKQRRRRRR